MRTPMPSPRGTNIERLVMPAAVAAYDAAPPPDGDMLKKLSDFLSDRMTPQDVATVLKMLGAGSDDDPAETTMAGDMAFRRGVTRDYAAGKINSVVRDQLLQRGPRTGDGASFLSRYPDAAKIKQA